MWKSHVKSWTFKETHENCTSWILKIVNLINSNFCFYSILTFNVRKPECILFEDTCLKGLLLTMFVMFALRHFIIQNLLPVTKSIIRAKLLVHIANIHFQLLEPWTDTSEKSTKLNHTTFQMKMFWIIQKHSLFCTTLWIINKEHF